MTLVSRIINQLSNARYRASLFSGVLLGVSFPSYPYVCLELIAWVALVPLLISLRTVETAGELFRRAFITMLLFCLISLWWVSLATLPGGILTVLAQACFMTLPLFAFYLIKKKAGYLFALFSLPFIWVAWEWSYMQQELSLGWLTFGNSQANLNVMIQYADITGVWGISFWLLWFNVLAVLVLIGSRREALRSLLIMVVMVFFPLLYSMLLFYSDGAVSKAEGQLRVTLVQPNIDPHGKWLHNKSVDIMERYYRMTERAVRENRPELLIWPETAIPFSIFDSDYFLDLQFLQRSLRQWQAPLLTGFVDVVYKGGGMPGEAYNASMLLEPGNSVPRIYHKMHLVPFAERVPYVDYFPWLGNATFSLSGIRGWGKGGDASVMELSSSHGKVVIANIICYESIFPAFVTEFVRKGARMLTLVTNDGWYATSYGPYQHLAIGRLRCIENRRAMARCANTGLTVVLDKFGRTIAEIPWWEEQTLTAEVPLESTLTFYTCNPDLLPKAAVLISALLLLVALLRRGSKAL